MHILAGKAMPDVAWKCSVMRLIQDSIVAIDSSGLCAGQLVVAALDNVSEESRESFFERHAQLRAQAEAAGEQLPKITREGVLAIAHEAVQDAEAQPVSLQSPLSCEKSASPVLMYCS